MLYYTHKETGELMASIENLRDLVIDSEITMVISDVIFPFRWLGNGILCHCMSYREIAKNYKKISKKKALQICPDLGQWRHIDDDRNRSVTYLGSLYLSELKPMRKYGFGSPFTKEGKERRKDFIETLPSELKEEYIKGGEDDGYDPTNIYWKQRKAI